MKPTRIICSEFEIHGGLLRWQLPVFSIPIFFNARSVGPPRGLSGVKNTLTGEAIPWHDAFGKFGVTLDISFYTVRAVGGMRRNLSSAGSEITRFDGSTGGHREPGDLAAQGRSLL